MRVELGRTMALVALVSSSCRPLTPAATEPDEHAYSIWGFVEGTLLQELFKTLPPSELVSIAGECGCVLASLASHRFERCGEFGAGLEIVQDYGRPSQFVPTIVHRALFEGRAGERLGAGLRDELWRVVERGAPLLKSIDDRYSLVHARLQALEPAHATFRRRVESWDGARLGVRIRRPTRHRRGAIPSSRPGFARGISRSVRVVLPDAGRELPADWLPLSRLVDVISQVTFLDDARDKPRVFAETIMVVKETIQMLA